MTTHLIIKLGALGDFVQATTAFRAIKLAHPNDQLILLTTALYQDFAHRLNYFDEIWLDTRPSFFDLKKLFNFRKQISKASISRIYDLQCVDRTQMYKVILKGAYKEWVGFSNNMSHIHPQKRFAALLGVCGVSGFTESLDLTTIATYSHEVQIEGPYVLIIPGASLAHHGAKKWSEEKFIELAKRIAQKGYQVVMIGGPSERFDEINQSCPFIKNLVGQTSFYDVIGLGAKAALTIGNDTGPTLLAASGGSPTVTFFSKHNPPNKGGALGVNHHQIYAQNLNELEVDQVWEDLMNLSYLESI